MVFSSPLFFFFFLPLTLALYFSAPRTLKNIVLLLASVVFYVWGELHYLPLLALSIVINYVAGILIAAKLQKYTRLGTISIAILLNLAGLFWFKYSAFAINNFNWLLQTLGISSLLPATTVPLPLGISFFTFHAISYLVDVYRKKVEPQKNFLDYALYILFFPQLIAGPIIRYHDIAKQFKERIHSWDNLVVGTERIIWGLAKKTLLANPLGEIADKIFGQNPNDLSSPAAWLGGLCYSLQIYYDFSGYSDMAIGLCRLFGFRILENFNYPYIAQSIQDFWHRWHISLSNWFRDYVYIPLGGNRASPLSTYRNLITVFLLCGLWHGASWTFVFWGIYHGTFLVLERLGLATVLMRLPPFLRHGYAILVIFIGWIFFRAENLNSAFSFLNALFTWHRDTPIQARYYLDTYSIIVLIIAVLAAAPWHWRFLPSPLKTSPFAMTFKSLWLVALTVLSFMNLAANTYNPFIYFRF